MGMLKVVKAVRIARVLRLLRLLRLFQRIRFADSVMAQRHTVRIITTVAASFIFFNMIIGTAFTFINSIDAEKSWVNEQQATMEYLNHMQLSNADSNAVENLGRFRPTILMIKERGEVLYARDSDSSLRTYFGPGDYMIRRAYPYTVWFDVRPVAVSHARLNVTVFLTTLAVILLLLITYSPHFALTVSDPVNVMTRGMKEKRL